MRFAGARPARVSGVVVRAAGEFLPLASLTLPAGWGTSTRGGERQPRADGVAEAMPACVACFSRGGRVGRYSRRDLFKFLSGQGDEWARNRTVPRAAPGGRDMDRQGLGSVERTPGRRGMGIGRGWGSFLVPWGPVSTAAGPALSGWLP